MEKFPRVILFVVIIWLERLPSVYCGKREPLFEGESLREFFESCTPRATHPCQLSSPEDFQRLRAAKETVLQQLKFIQNEYRLGANALILMVIIILTIHLIIARRFDWRNLPVIKSYYAEAQEEVERKTGVRYHQYIWMKYSVLEGNHPVFAKRDLNEINWYKYKPRKTKFDYESVKIQKFMFLDKQKLATELEEEIKAAEHHEHDDKKDHDRP